MPVLGGPSTTTATAGLTQRGAVVPKGALDRWAQAKTVGASSLFEVAIIGDSTTYGAADATTADPFYTWVRHLRTLSVGAGVPDGGYGIYHPADRFNGEFNAAASTYPKTSAITGFGDVSAAAVWSFKSSVPGDSVTVQGEGTAIRLLTYRSGGVHGSMTYSVDGGAAQSVNLSVTTNGVGYVCVPIHVGGLTNGVHSVTVVNTSSGGKTTAEFNVEFLNTTGVVYHRDALNGSASSSWGDSVQGDAKSLSDTPVRMGLTGVMGTGFTRATDLTANGYAWGAAKGPNPQYRNVRLSLVQIGTNDVNSASATDSNDQMAERYLENVALAVRTARAADSDVVLISPPHTASVHPQGQRQHGRFKAVLLDIALSHGCAYVDFQEALGWDVWNWAARGYGPGTVSNPHLTKTAYQAEATFLWNNVLGPAVA